MKSKCTKKLGITFKNDHRHFERSFGIALKQISLQYKRQICPQSTSSVAWQAADKSHFMLESLSMNGIFLPISKLRSSCPSKDSGRSLRSLWRRFCCGRGGGLRERGGY